jgi:hypothetical protein
VPTAGKDHMRLPKAFIVLFVIGLVRPGSITSQEANPPARPSRWVLVYTGGPHRPAYSVDDFVHLIGTIDTTDRPTGWLSDGAIFLELYSVSGRAYVRFPAGSPGDGADWNVYLDSVFAPMGPIARLDSAVQLMSQAAGPLGRPYQLAMMIPYPDQKAGSIQFAGSRFDLTGMAGRAAAARTYVGEVLKRFSERNYHHITLSSFYWAEEGVVDLPDTLMVSAVAGEVHRSGRRFLWIPAYGNQGVPKWRSMGFDEAWLQPNLFFHPEVSQTRLDSALTIARGLGMGIEVEFDRRMFNSTVFADRLVPYLDALEAAPDFRARSIAIYEGGGALIQLSRTHDERHRALYDRLVRVLQAP